MVKGKVAPVLGGTRQRANEMVIVSRDVQEARPIAAQKVLGKPCTLLSIKSVAAPARIALSCPYSWGGNSVEISLRYD